MRLRQAKKMILKPVSTLKGNQGRRAVVRCLKHFRQRLKPTVSRKLTEPAISDVVAG